MYLDIYLQREFDEMESILHSNDQANKCYFSYWTWLGIVSD